MVALEGRSRKRWRKLMIYCCCFIYFPFFGHIIWFYFAINLLLLLLLLFLYLIYSCCCCWSVDDAVIIRPKKIIIKFESLQGPTGKQGMGWEKIENPLWWGSGIRIGRIWGCADREAPALHRWHPYLLAKPYVNILLKVF